MAKLTYTDMRTCLQEWLAAWNRHDLDGVMALFTEDVVFEHWTGSRIIGREKLRRAWQPWFAQHGDFHFGVTEIIIDVESQKAIISWRLTWPSTDQPGFIEERDGLDVVYFANGRISTKLTYTKTAVSVHGPIQEDKS